MKREKIIDNLSFIIGVLSVIFVVLYKDNILIAGIIAGIGATLYGFLKALQEKNFGYILISVGISLITSLLVYKYKILDRADSLTLMICLSTFILMIITSIFAYFNRKKTFKKYDLNIEAEAIDLIKNPNTNKDYYQVVYSYEINNKYYSVKTPGFINSFIPKIGDKITIYVESSDHANVYFDKTKREKIYEIGLSLFLIIASFIIIIFLFI